MLLRILAFSVLTWLVLTSMTVTYAQSDTVDELERRHTPGFPAILNITSIADLARISTPELREALSRILECDTLECLRDDMISGRIIESLAVNTTGISIRNLTSMSDRELLNLINDPSLRGLLESLNSSQGVDPGDIANVIRALEEGRRSESISPQAYIAALELIKRIVERGGGETGWIERRQVEALRDAILEASRTGLLADILMRLSNLYREAQQFNPNTQSPRGVVDVRVPEVNMSLPAIPLELVALIILFILATILLFNSHRIWVLTENLLGGERVIKGSRDLPLVLRVYWDAVRFVERVTGVKMGLSTTHREYYEQSHEKLGLLSKPFSELTKAYELYRFAGFRDASIEDKALRSHRELVGERGRT